MPSGGEKKKKSRMLILSVLAAAVLALLLWAFWPRPLPVDFGEVSRGPVRVTIDEEARTEVRNTYLVAAPFAGRLLRIEAEPGDEVIAGKTVIARMLPVLPAVLDQRSRDQAAASVDAAMAAVRLARADLERARAAEALAVSSFERQEKLFRSETVSVAALDAARQERQAAAAGRAAAEAALSMRRAELVNARALLESLPDMDAAPGEQTAPVLLRAPVSGQILQVFEQSETTLSPGQPVLEIGNIRDDLEIVIDLLSADAVRVAPGTPVRIEGWGGDGVLAAEISRTEPAGFTKYSALGVEEQRVKSYASFLSPARDRAGLGHGFRVEARIVVWEKEDALTVPSSALFRQDGGWALYLVEGGRARLKKVSVDQNTGRVAALATPLAEGAKVILYPGPEISDGTAVTPRTGGDGR